jgi:uncharacterized cupin superfamily protein
VADATVKTIDELEASMGGGFKHVSRSLGMTSLGVNILDIPPGYEDYPEHDHSKDGQEELYIPIAGSATITIDGEDHRLEPGVLVRVGAGTSRKIVTGEDPVRIIALGGIPGQAYPAG